MNYTDSSGAEQVHVSAHRGSAGLPDAYYSAMEGKNYYYLYMYACLYDYLPFVAFLTGPA